MASLIGRRVRVFALAAVMCELLAACGGDGTARGQATHAEPAGRILLSQKRGEHRDIYVISPDGSDLRRLTASTGEAVAPELSPDGRTIVYEDDEPTRAVIAVVGADGRGRRVLTPSGFQGQPAWSPDGQWIVFERDMGPGDNGVWLMRSDGSQLRRLTRNPFAGGECGCDTDPAFSPDGQQISFVRVRSERSGLGALFVMGRSGDDLHRLTSWRFDPGVKHAWKPDGSALMVSSNAHAPPDESSNLYVLGVDGTGPTALTDFRDGAPNAQAGSWSPDGRWIVLKTDETGSFQLHVMDAAGRNRHPITTTLNDPSGVVWGP